MIAAAKSDAKALARLAYTIGDMRQLPYTSNYFDKVFCFWASFNHLLTEEDQFDCLSEIYRVLRPTGYALLVLADPHSKYWKDNMEKAQGRIAQPENLGICPPMFIHDQSTIGKLLSQTMFSKSDLEVRTMNHSTRLVVHLHK